MARKELKEYQDTPSPKEDLEKIPLLKRSDIRKEAEKFILTEREIGGTKVLAHELFTSGIGYLRVMFRTDHVPSRDLPYVGLLKAVLGFVDTTKHTYSDLSDEINLNTGGITLSVSSYADSRKQARLPVFLPRMPGCCARSWTSDFQRSRRFCLIQSLMMRNVSARLWRRRNRRARCV